MRLKNETPRSGEAGESRLREQKMAHWLRHAVFLRLRAFFVGGSKFSVRNEFGCASARAESLAGYWRCCNDTAVLLEAPHLHLHEARQGRRLEKARRRPQQVAALHRMGERFPR